MLAIVLDLLGRELVDVELPPQERLAGPDQRGGAGGEVDGRKRPRRPDLHPPHRLVAHPRGREHGHAAALELQPGVGHVFVAAQDAKAPSASTFRSGERTSDSTRSMSWIIRSSTTPTSVERKVKPEVRTASMNLGLRTCGSAGGQGRVEPLDVADLEDDGCGGGRPRPARRPRPASAHSGFSTSRWTPDSQEVHGQLVVQPRGRGDHRGVDLAQQRAVIGQGLRVALGGQAVAVGGHGIDHGHQLDVRQADEFLGVESAQAAGADDGDVQFLHG